MTELYPCAIGDELATLGSGGDALKLCRGTQCRYFLWISATQAVEVNDLIRKGIIPTSRGPLRIDSWLTAAPYIHAKTIELDSYVENLAKSLGPKLEGKVIVVGYSGGKDSTAALIILTLLQNFVNFRLRAIYVYIPYLDNPSNLRFVDYVSKRLGIDIEVVEPRRRVFRSYLRWLGLPQRGNRWCTRFKAEPMRRILRELGDRGIEVVADRALESAKRARKLYLSIVRGSILTGRKFRVVATLTLLDVISIVKRFGLVNPQYLEGMPRVSCTLCPYRSLYELGLASIDGVEDPGLVETVLRKMHVQRYSFVEWSTFCTRALWRFRPREAAKLVALHNLLSRVQPERRSLSSNTVSRLYTYPWIHEIGAPLLRLEDIASILYGEED